MNKNISGSMVSQYLKPPMIIDRCRKETDYYVCVVKNHTPETFDLIVVGGGAAGFYGAIQACEQKPGLKVLILEKSNKLLAKVKVSGGGRCNVTHNCFNPVELSRHYPRGQKFLKNIFKRYAVNETIHWFEKNGVVLKKEDDGRMFPTTDNSQTIIDCFVNQAIALKIKIELGEGVVDVQQRQDGFEIKTVTDKKLFTKRLLIAIGGNPGPDFYKWIRALGHEIVPPIPSLFTFNDFDKRFTDLMGVSVPNGEVRIVGTKLKQEGPVLITHWGLSGPAVIRLSAWAAEHLHRMKYEFDVMVSWIGAVSEEEIRKAFAEHKNMRGKQKVISNPQYGLPQRLWIKLCELAEISDQKIWGELPQKNINRLIEFLIKCPFKIRGKTTFKEEFVTCGGVDLKEVDFNTMQSKIVPGIYFAGEVLNIDGETGGFNFQAAWSTATIAARASASSV